MKLTNGAIKEITENDRMIVLTFSFSNFEAIPPGLQILPKETQEQSDFRQQRKSNPSGKDLLAGFLPGNKYPERVCISSIPRALLNSGYRLVNTKRQEQIGRGSSNLDTYFKLRFFFVRDEFAKKYQAEPINNFGQFKPYQFISLVELQSVCSLALWRVRAFHNPFWDANGPVTNAWALGLNFEVRVPLYEHDSFAKDLRPFCLSGYDLAIKNKILYIFDR